jgi:ATP-dependent helicase YprA (DUF1998 family)
MMNTLQPIDTMNHIRETYLRYLKTIYPFQNQQLRIPFWQVLEEEGRLVKGPLLESAPPFATGKSISRLVEDGILHPNFRLLCSKAMPWERPLYLHQDKAITHVVQNRRNLIVASGTGSGKTETFLIPILDHLLREESEGTLQQPGVRALLLYPMNALANDQLKRLRRVLREYPTITFGRYTGETDEEDSGAINRFHEQFPHEILLKNELLSRRQMRSTPPHILLTNYAMLEYLLLRPEDCELFDGETGKHWHFLVLDEAHIYDGASGIELAMLLRRLKERVVGSRHGKLRCIATSATLGRGRDDFPAAVTFASNLFDELFEWDDATPHHQDILEGIRQPMAALGEAWGEGSPLLYQALRQILVSDAQESVDVPEVLESLVRETALFVPARVGETARELALAQWGSGPDAPKQRAICAIEAFLYGILSGDKRLHHLQEYLGREPYFLDEIAHTIFPDEENPNNLLVTLVELAVRARPDPTSLSLLPARYHAFARALEGVFVCFSARDHANGQPHIFLNRYAECPDCGGLVVELATCVRCGATYLVGRSDELRDIQQDSSGLHQHHRFLRQLTEDTRGLPGHPAYFLPGSHEEIFDEDEVIVAGDDLAQEGDAENLATLCLRCGSLAPKDQKRCNCNGSLLSLQEVPLKGNAELRWCINCGARSTGPLVFRFLTGQDAPVSVLATALYQQLPPDPEVPDLPGEGRKLLIFSDSRQDAAFFAPYLERTYNQVLHRRLILEALLNEQDGRLGNLRLQDLVSRLRRQAEKAGIFSQRQSHDERQRTVWTWLMQELVSLDRRLSLEGIGLLQFRLVRPVRWRPPDALLGKPWNLNEDEAWTLIALLLDTLRQQGVTTFPDLVDPRDEQFSPRNKVLFVRKDQSDSTAEILSWVPTRRSNRRLDLLERLLERCQPDVSDEERRRIAKETLDGLWRYLTDPGSRWQDHLVSENRARHGIVYRLSHEFWELVPLTDSPIYRCNRCRAFTSLSLRNLCPTLGCNGKLEECSPETLKQEENHYRALYLHMHAHPLSAEEHTAQWTNNEAGRVQERFIHSEINVLSCSTTFELGVDVGELQAILMRNVPPTTANYVQRAGRAGRRADSAAFALTYAQRRSHDLTHYQDPRKIIAGRVQAPRVMLSNAKIVQRHMQAVLLAAFLRHARDQEKRVFANIGDFFQPLEDQVSGIKLLIQFTEEKPEAVRAALKRIVPEDLHSEMGVEDWGWLRSADQDGFLDLAERVDAEVTTDLELYRQLEDEAAADRQYGLSQHFQRVTRTIRSRSLLGFLASRNVLPKYGFPTDVVELKTDHLSTPEASKVQLERDLRIAIAEYAPGAEIVAAKRIWTGGGLYKQPKRDWPVYHYAICNTCNRFLRSLEDIGAICECGGKLSERRNTFVIPEFGFVAASDNIRTPGESRPQRLYASRVYFAEYAPPHRAEQQSIKPSAELVPALSGQGVQVSVSYSRFGKLALVNEGIAHRGFRICQQCGFAEMAPEPPPPGVRRRRSGPEAHRHPRTGKPCTGFTQTHHLGHEFLTDVTELHFSGLLALRPEWELWRSLMYALLEGASEAHSIRRDDLDGTLYLHLRGEAPAIVLFDNVPGGAGHVKRIAEDPIPVFEAAYQRVNNECCGPETSCYECLRNYRNQPYHDQLQRGLARDFLHKVLEAVQVKSSGRGNAWHA